jgi:hypothetical protein
MAKPKQGNLRSMAELQSCIKLDTQYWTSLSVHGNIFYQLQKTRASNKQTNYRANRTVLVVQLQLTFVFQHLN